MVPTRASGLGGRSGARACCSGRSTTTRPPTTSPRRDQARPRHDGRFLATVCSAVASSRASTRSSRPRLRYGRDTAGAAQILTFVGVLESYDEIPDGMLRYTASGGPGSTALSHEARELGDASSLTQTTRAAQARCTCARPSSSSRVRRSTPRGGQALGRAAARRLVYPDARVHLPRRRWRAVADGGAAARALEAQRKRVC